MSWPPPFKRARSKDLKKDLGLCFIGVLLTTLQLWTSIEYLPPVLIRMHPNKTSTAKLALEITSINLPILVLLCCSLYCLRTRCLTGYQPPEIPLNHTPRPFFHSDRSAFMEVGSNDKRTQRFDSQTNSPATNDSIDHSTLTVFNPTAFKIRTQSFDSNTIDSLRKSLIPHNNPIQISPTLT